MSCEKQVEECDESTFEFWSTSSVDGCGRESFPDNRFANVRSDEEIDTGSETVTLLQQLVKENDEQARNDELEN